MNYLMLAGNLNERNFDKPFPRYPEWWKPLPEVKIRLSTGIWRKSMVGYRTTPEERIEIARKNIANGVDHLIEPDMVEMTMVEAGYAINAPEFIVSDHPLKSLATLLDEETRQLLAEARASITPQMWSLEQMLAKPVQPKKRGRPKGSKNKKVRVSVEPRPIPFKPTELAWQLFL